jgi:hypothetical protein
MGGVLEHVELLQESPQDLVNAPAPSNNIIYMGYIQTYRSTSSYLV